MRREVVASLERVTLELRHADGVGRFVGLAAVYGKRAAIGDPRTWGFWEQIAPGAFDRALSEEQDVPLLFNHNRDHLLARTGSGTMTLSSGKKGLQVEADLADTSVGADVRKLLERGDLSKMSFAFDAKADSWEQLKDGSELRTVLDADLYDASIVTSPAYKETEAALRAAVTEARAASPFSRERWREASARFDRIAQPGPRAF